MRVILILLVALGVGAIALAAYVIAGRSGAFVPSEASLRDRYAAESDGALFVTVDGVALHYRDTGGDGAPLVLLPGHLGSVLQFEGWAEALAPEFRVIRLDWPPYGMSGPDPSGQYSTDRAEALVSGFVDALGLDRFHLGGTSNGATVALHYAARHPDRIGRIVVSTVPLGPPGERARPPSAAYERWIWLAGNVFPDWRPEPFYRHFLEYVFSDPSRVTDAMVRSVADQNSRAGSADWVAEYVRTNIAMYQDRDLTALYRTIDAPILLQWGDDGPVLPPDYAEVVMDAFSDASLIRYADAGHMPTWEIPERTARDAAAFLRAGAL